MKAHRRTQLSSAGCILPIRNGKWLWKFLQLTNSRITSSYRTNSLDDSSCQFALGQIKQLVMDIQIM